LNQPYYRDNLQVLREHIADESVDLIYLDPPFNSKRDYNLLFKSPKGIKPDDVRALNHVRERERADIALFISLEEPTPAMVNDAASVGFYESVSGRSFRACSSSRSTACSTARSAPSIPITSPT
jgi:hypothetical protein